jgi:hypothetical protein
MGQTLNYEFPKQDDILFQKMPYSYFTEVRLKDARYLCPGHTASVSERQN